MQTAPKTPGLLLNTPLNIVNTFIKLREVTGDVACLSLGKKSLDYRGMLRVNTLNFALMAEEEQDAVIEGFKAFLNGISFPIQILVRNSPHNLDGYLQVMDSVQGDLAEIAHDHANFVRLLASKRALVKRTFYIIVPADHQNTRNANEAMINAQLQIKLRLEELLRQLERIGLSGQRLKNQEIVALYQSCLTPTEAWQRPVTEAMLAGVNTLVMSARDNTFNYELVRFRDQNNEEENEEVWNRKGKNHKKQREEKRGRKAQEAKTNLPGFVHVPDLVAPSAMQVFPWYIRVDGETGQEYVRTLTFVSYPRSVYPGWFDNLIQIDEPHVDFSIHIQPLAPEQVNAMLGRKATEFRGSVLVAQRQGRNPDPTTSIALQDVEQMRDKLARGDERVFKIAVFVMVRAHNKRELSERSNRIAAAVRSLDFRVLPAHWQHHVGFLSCLPDAQNALGGGRLFGTSSAATFYPFTGGDPSMDSGVMFGVLPSGGLVIINPFKSDEVENANLVVFAKSGAGKSFFLKTVTSRLLPTCNVYVIDPENEYGNMCANVRGQYIKLSSETLQLNPLDLYGQRGQNDSEADPEDREEANFFREKLLNLVTLLELLLSDSGSLSQREKAFLYRCLVKVYEVRGITVDPRTHSRSVPNMQELYLVMSSALRGDYRFGVGEDVHGLAERLERYLHLFPNRTQVSLENRYIDFNIRELNDALKPLGLFLITEFLWTKMRQARMARVLKNNTIILIDEAWLLMQFPQGAKFLAEFARRIRKYGGGLWCTTQNSDDFLSSEEGRTILAMSTMKFLMKQDSSTIESVTRTFRLSEGQRKALLGARRGEGLFGTKNWVSMEVVASPLETRMANTTLGQVLPESEPIPEIDSAFKENVIIAGKLDPEAIRAKMRHSSGPILFSNNGLNGHGKK